MSKQILLKAANLIDEELRQEAKTSGMAFSLFYQKDYHTVSPARFHYRMHNVMDKEIAEGRGKIIVAPREHAKTTVVQHNIQRKIVTKEVNYVMYISDTMPQAIGQFRNLVDGILENEAVMTDFGLGPCKTDTRTKTVLSNNVMLECVSTGTKMRGKKHSHYRPDLIVLDDILNQDNCESPDQCRKVMDWLMKVVLPLGSNKTKIIWIGTYMNFYDPLYICSTEPQYKEFWQPEIFPAIHPFSGKALWPEHKSREWLLERKAIMGTYAFASEYELNPIDQATAVFKRDFIEKYGLESFDTFKRKIAYNDDGNRFIKVAYVDIAMNLDKKGDKNVYIEGWIDVRDSSIPMYVTSCAILDVSIHSFVEWILERLRTQPVDVLGVETVAFQALVRETLVKQAIDKGINLPHIVSVDNRVRKETRILGVQPYIESGVIKLCMFDCFQLIEQMLKYPKGKYDDAVDSLAGLIGLRNSTVNQVRYEVEGSFLDGNVSLFGGFE